MGGGGTGGGNACLRREKVVGAMRGEVGEGARGANAKGEKGPRGSVPSVKPANRKSIMQVESSIRAMNPPPTTSRRRIESVSSAEGSINPGPESTPAVRAISPNGHLQRPEVDAHNF